MPDGWISDSPIWVDDVSSRLGAGWATQGGIIATSLVVFAIPKSLQGQPALASAAATATAQELATDKAQRTALLQRVITLSRSTEADDSLLNKATKGTDVARIFPTSEQQVAGFNQ